MTEENDTPQPDEANQPKNVADEVTETFAKLGGGERLAVLGAAIVLGGWLVFDLLIDDYSTGTTAFVLAVLVVGAAYTHHRRTSGSDPVPYGTVIFVGAGILGLLGVIEVIEELRNNILDTDAVTIIGALVFYVGAIMSGVGAVQLRGSNQV